MHTSVVVRSSLITRYNYNQIWKCNVRTTYTRNQITNSAYGIHPWCSRNNRALIMIWLKRVSACFLLDCGWRGAISVPSRLKWVVRSGIIIYVRKHYHMEVVHFEVCQMFKVHLFIFYLLMLYYIFVGDHHNTY